ncbi:MAG: hypothetical protein BAJALOKI1v1_1270003 [Promethearchaeota archaeon]|nr:MAG: hypothetical protein BAJALOKI1v1_1270003 [Candidatus Lokiarchaeota archaeon]
MNNINTRKQEIETIREKINEVIRYSENYWMIYKKDTFGLATILNLDYKKSYIEILFFPNTDVLEKGATILEIYTPIETQVDFNDILIDPDFDDDDIISPSKIVKRIDKLITEEFQFHLSNLDYEVELIDKKFENYPINNNPYYRTVILYFPGFSTELEVDFEKYPLKPLFYFSKRLSKIIKLEEFLEFEELQQWDDHAAPHIADLIDHLIDVILKRLKLVDYFKNYQILLLENIKAGDLIQHLSLVAHRGQSVGILFNTSNPEFIEKVNIVTLFNSIAGTSQKFSGTIKIFGKFAQLLTKEDQAKIFVLPKPIDSKIAQLKVKNAITYNLELSLEKPLDDEELQARLIEAGLTTIIDELISQGAVWKVITYFKKIMQKRNFLSNLLKLTALNYKKNKKVDELKPIDFLRFSIARALVQKADIIMFSIPEGLFDRLQFKEFKNEIDNIKKEFHTIFLIEAPEEFVEQCDKIITITDKKVDVGRVEDLITQIPQQGEIITIELNYPTTDTLKQLFSVQAIIIEERHNEKYKMFPKIDSKTIIKQIIHILGPELLNFERKKANLNDYIKYFKIQQEQQKINLT